MTQKPKSKKATIFVVIGIILALLGLDYYKFHFILGTDVTVTDTSIVITPAIDTASGTATTDTLATSASVTATDTAKPMPDTTKKEVKSISH